MAITPVFAIRLDPELRAALQSLADADNRSLANYIETALRMHVGAKEAREHSVTEQTSEFIKKIMQRPK